MNTANRMGFGLALAGAFVAFAVAARSEAPHAPVTCRIALDRAVLPAGGAQEAVVKVTLDGVRAPERGLRPPVNLCIVLDRSGSMSGDKIARAKEAAIEALRRLGERDLFSLVAYNHTVETLVPAQSAAHADSIERQIRGLDANGNTALFGGVSQAASEIRKNLTETYVHRIVLLSDGLANVGPSSPDELGRLGAGLLKEGISVSTVGVGSDYNEDLMARLAQQSDGNTYFAATGEDLPRIFNGELGDVLSVVAKKVQITIECPDGVEPIAIIGREGRIEKQRVELFLNQLYGGQEKYVLVRLRIAEGSAGSAREVAVARVTYEDALSNRSMTTHDRAEARYSDRREEVERSANVEVGRAYEYNQAAVAQDEAIREADKGDRAQAGSVLRKRAFSLRSWGTRNNDAEAVSKAESLDAAAARVEESGMSRDERKSMRADAYQEVNQQNQQ